ncbi:beta-1,4-galactosyltransferase 4-like isoform X4 [Dermacentor andersoni]|uniref:beta-1,4-galactosyltransferase 4-like isoform X4 n=1 Tax=Dermacentor andersoni TaxID=34620 RepID=UPI002415A312|nr:beta-1,4-galactosyltransferase 4-like isoform X9 [Dermacentor andersoni]
MKSNFQGQAFPCCTHRMGRHGRHVLSKTYGWVYGTVFEVIFIAASINFIIIASRLLTQQPCASRVPKRSYAFGEPAFSSLYAFSNGKTGDASETILAFLLSRDQSVARCEVWRSGVPAPHALGGGRPLGGSVPPGAVRATVSRRAAPAGPERSQPGCDRENHDDDDDHGRHSRRPLGDRPQRSWSRLHILRPRRFSCSANALPGGAGTSQYLPLILKSAANLGGARSTAFRVLGVGVIQLLIGCVGAAPAVGRAVAFGHAVTARQSHNVVEPSVGQRHATLARKEQAAPRSEFCSVDWGQGSDILKIQRKGPPLEELEKAMPHLKPGGRWFPTHCKARQRVALVVPYRDRLDNLRAFLQHMHPFLQRQQLDYAIYLVEQNGTGDFNRAKLLNVGYEIAKAMDDYDCFIFHDVDLLPENKRNEYACKDGGPLHMTTCLDYQKYKPFYATIFGGVCALRSDHMEKVNGFSNVFWGWGGEDDDMSIRLRFSGFNIVRNDCTVGRYTSLKHVDVRRNPERFRLLRRSFFRIFKDGLNTLQYSVLDIVFKKLYTHVIVDLSAHTASEPEKETRKESKHT